MIRLFLTLLFISLSSYLSSSQEQEESPVSYNSIEAGMTPEETVKILGRPDSKDTTHGELSYLYILEDGSVLALNFYKKRWLYEIYVFYHASFDCREFGLSSDGGQGFKIHIIDGKNRIWEKSFNTKKFGEIMITYRNKPGNATLINAKAMKVINPLIFER